MNRTPKKIFVCAVVLVCSVVWLALYDFQKPLELQALTGYILTDAKTPVISAASYYVFDLNSGKKLVSNNEHTVASVASITKLSAAGAIHAGNLQWDTVTINWSDVATHGRSGGLQYGESYMLHTLLFPLLLESSNDAAATLSRNDAGLIQRMNELAQHLELHDTHFADASGLSASNVSTAAQLGTLLQHIAFQYPHIIDITQLQHYLSEEKGWRNNSPFIEDPAYRGGKHGYTNAAGSTAVSIFNETFSKGVTQNVGYIILGSSDLVQDMYTLRSYITNHVNYTTDPDVSTP